MHATPVLRRETSVSIWVLLTLAHVVLHVVVLYVSIPLPVLTDARAATLLACATLPPMLADA